MTADPRLLRIARSFFLSAVILCAGCCGDATGPGGASSSAAGPKKPKYGAATQPLSHAHGWLRTHDAPDFWALSPYYAAQQDEHSCGAASVTMLVNAARTRKDLRAEDQLVDQATLLARVPGGPGLRGIELDALGPFAAAAARAWGSPSATAEVVHAEDTPAFRAHLREALIANEKSSRDFILANFLQSVLTGDPDGAVGHIAPIAAYDEEGRRVLILDPDRRWYEPYWVSEDALVSGMATKDAGSGKTRGFVWVKLGVKATE